MKKHIILSAVCMAAVVLFTSASKPSWRSTGIPKDCKMFSITGTCACKSSGVLSRFALYWSYIHHYFLRSGLGCW